MHAQSLRVAGVYNTRALAFWHADSTQSYVPNTKEVIGLLAGCAEEVKLPEPKNLDFRNQLCVTIAVKDHHALKSWLCQHKLCSKNVANFTLVPTQAMVQKLRDNGIVI